MMRDLLKFRSVSLADKWLLIEAATLLSVAYAALRLLPSNTVIRLAARYAQPRNIKADMNSQDKVVWAVTMISHQFIKVSCLPQALTAQMLLAWRGIAADLRIGVIKTQSGGFEGHAWLESDGRIIYGGAESSRFIPVEGLSRHYP